MLRSEREMSEIDANTLGGERNVGIGNGQMFKQAIG